MRATFAVKRSLLAYQAFDFINMNVSSYKCIRFHKLSRNKNIPQEELELLSELPRFKFDDTQGIGKEFVVLSVHRQVNNVYVMAFNIEKGITLSFYLKELKDENTICDIADLIIKQKYKDE